MDWPVETVELKGEARPRTPPTEGWLAAKQQRINDRLRAVEADELSFAEVLGAYLYSGAMFIVYNTELRKISTQLKTDALPAPRVDFHNSIHVAAASLHKLSMLTQAHQIPPSTPLCSFPSMLSCLPSLAAAGSHLVPIHAQWQAASSELP